MSSSWELICDHTYTGIPGVVVDRSPSGASYGQMLGLDDTDFQSLKPGAGPPIEPVGDDQKRALLHRHRFIKWRVRVP